MFDNPAVFEPKFPWVLTALFAGSCLLISRKKLKSKIAHERVVHNGQGTLRYSIPQWSAYVLSICVVTPGSSLSIQMILVDHACEE